MYDNDLYKILSDRNVSQDLFKNVLGGEVALWSEQVRQVHGKTGVLDLVASL